jgi:hypothetical protein
MELVAGTEGRGLPVLYAKAKDRLWRSRTTLLLSKHACDVGVKEKLFLIPVSTAEELEELKVCTKYESKSPLELSRV